MSSSPSSTRLDASEGAAESPNVRERLSFATAALRAAVSGSDTTNGELADWFRPGYLLEVAADIERLLATSPDSVLRTEEAPSVGRMMLGEHERACPRCGGEVFVPGEGDVRIPLPEGGMALGCRLCGNQWLRELPPALSRSRDASPPPDDRGPLVAWLIERSHDGHAEWLTSVITPEWTTDANAAVKLDTEAVAHREIMRLRQKHAPVDLTLAHPTEHVWFRSAASRGDGPNEPSALQRDASGDLDLPQLLADVIEGAVLDGATGRSLGESYLESVQRVERSVNYQTLMLALRIARPAGNEGERRG